jgi:hypothetical protein
LGLTDGDVNLLRRVDCDILIQDLFIPPRYNFFSESPVVKNFKVKYDGGLAEKSSCCVKVRTKIHKNTSVDL